MTEQKNDPGVQSDRSLLSMLVDAMVARPEHFERLANQGAKIADMASKQALQAISAAFTQVRWRELDEHARRERMLEIIQQLLSTSPAGELAARALDWGLKNRAMRRPRQADEQDLSAADIDS